MKLSVIIPCLNEAGTVEILLDSLVAQTQAPSEVVVIDSLSTDDTMKRVANYRGKLPIVTATASEKGQIAARNLGADEAKGDYLLFIDADVKLPVGFIKTLQQEISQKGLEAGGVVQKLDSKKWGLRFGGGFMNFYMRAMSHTSIPIAFSCFFATKKAHTKINGFDPKIFIMEDYDYVMRTKSAGFKVGVITSTFFWASDRRYDNQNGLKNIWRGFYGEIYRYTHGLKVDKQIYKYKMGGQQNKKS